MRVVVPYVQAGRSRLIYPSLISQGRSLVMTELKGCWEVSASSASGVFALHVGALGYEGYEIAI